MENEKHFNLLRGKMYSIRDKILKSLEEHNSELSEAFVKYNEIRIRGFPKIGDGEKIDPKTSEFIVNTYYDYTYYDHRAALEIIIEYSKILKADIENLVSFFEEGEKKQEEIAELISEQIKKHERRKNKKAAGVKY
jgi:hypothetical protein